MIYLGRYDRIYKKGKNSMDIRYHKQAVTRILFY